MSNLTSSMQHYLQAIYELSSGGEGVRISDVANKRKVSKSSACTAMKVLQAEGLIRRDSMRLVLLTEKGEEQAIAITNRFDIIRLFLMNVLGISKKNADADACAMEHTISIETLCSFCRFQNDINPHWHCKGGCHVSLCEVNP